MKKIDFLEKIAYNNYATFQNTKIKEFFYATILFFIEWDIIWVDYIYLSLYKIPVRDECSVKVF